MEAVRRVLGAVVLLQALAGTTADAAERAPGAVREPDLKATLLFDFTQFVEWPASAFPDADTPITIGVLGDDPFGASLDSVVVNERVRGRSIAVRRYRSVDEIGVCHVLYISSSESSRLGTILPALAGRGILTVGESDGFADRAGIMRLFVAGHRARLRINLGAARAAGLTISSKLLRLADIVGAPAGSVQAP